MLKITQKLTIYSLSLVLCICLLCLFYWQSIEVDYIKLERLLSKGQWMKADRETSKIMTKLTKKAVDERTFFGYSTLDFLGGRRYGIAYSGLYLCQDLQKVDELWSKYSQGNFGFKAQSKIALSFAPNFHQLSNEGRPLTQQFEKQVGWEDKKYIRTKQWYSQFQKPEKAKGSLPSIIWLLDIRQNIKPLKTYNVILTVERFRNCK
ncbi:MAG: GUN4 domain-containing protein [Nostoc sp.]|uniref:GUN4 domain-containing protein n=1 Tax=Nostoc sp. TaxID=1180 RepID=UPI002FF9B426